MDKVETDDKSVEFIKCDLSQKHERLNAWNHIIQKYKRVDVLINNAAIARVKQFSEMSFEQYEETVQINYLAYVHLTKLFMA